MTEYIVGSAPSDAVANLERLKNKWGQTRYMLFKLSAHSRTHAAALAVQTGVLRLRTATLPTQNPVSLGFDCRRKASHNHVA